MKKTLFGSRLTQVGQIFQSVSKLHTNFSEAGRLLPSKDGSLAIFSLSNSIFHNLAFENYLAEALNKQRDRNILLMWISKPCIVIGRHQNPWLECNLVESNRRSVAISRRYSGGGCVYHDLGNLNISFLTDRARYDRQTNLRLIKDTLDQTNAFSGIEFELSPRHDIFIKKLYAADDSDRLFKLSGSAARLAGNFSYHHCTLLFDAVMENMKLLRSNLEDKIVTKATRSVRSKCLNLRSFLTPSKSDLVNLDFMAQKLSEQYWRKHYASWAIDHLFNYVNPETDPIISKIIEPSVKELQSWDYIFGSTPKFQLTIDLDSERSAKVVLTVVNGLITEFELTSEELEPIRQTLQSFVGSKFTSEDLGKQFDQHVALVNSNTHFKNLYDFVNKNVA